MPIYEYQCNDCAAVIETLQRMSDPPLTTCESCGGELKRLISAPAFQFKGSGWYVTDYADKGKSAAGQGDDGSKSGQPSKSGDSSKSGEGSKGGDGGSASGNKASSSSSTDKKSDKKTQASSSD